MKRRVSAFLVAMALLAAQLLAGAPRAMAAEAGGGLILKVHYHREDANYENWTPPGTGRCSGGWRACTSPRGR